jgi:nicotinamide mononucleotide (NMN) deamidase PncC
MRVTVNYHDNESLLVEEIIKHAKTNYGATASVIVSPESDTPLGHLYFAIQRYITGKHLTLMYDSGPTYQKDLEQLRSETLFKLGEILDEVIIDNESKIA